MSYTDSYQAYVEGAVYSGNPVRLVVALYEGTIEAVRAARECLSLGDIMGRSHKINKAIKLLTELLVSLDHERGGDISSNLKKLYGYMQSRLLEAHAKQKAEPLIEVERLLSNLLEAWLVVAEKTDATQEQFEEREQSGEVDSKSDGSDYGAFTLETGELSYSVSATF